jgi:PilZ domain
LELAMTATELKGVTKAVVRRAQRQGAVSPRDVREELKQAGLSRARWKDVIASARSELCYREGLYYYAAPDPSVVEEHRQHQEVSRAVRKLIRKHLRSAEQTERRREGRADFIQQVSVETEDGRTFQLLSRDISPTGIRLIGTRSLLGQKVRLTIPSGAGDEPGRFLVRILWTCSVGDELFENGGSFLELLADPANPSTAAAGNGTYP